MVGPRRTGCGKWRADEWSTVDSLSLSVDYNKDCVLCFYVIVPRTLLKEADPLLFSSTSSPIVSTEKGNSIIPFAAIAAFFSFF